MPGVFRDSLLAGRTAFVTGGAGGINRAIARRFAEHGARLALLGRTPETLESAKEEVLRAGAPDAAVFAADVRDYAAVSGSLAETAAQFGAIDIVICGAAGNFPAPALGMSANGFKAVVDIDLLGTFNTCRAAFEHMKKPGGSVIAISATHAFTPIANQAHVCAAKAGVDILIKTLAVEWGPAGVRLNCISPGPVEDTEGMRRLAPDPDTLAKTIQSIPIGRFGTKDEIADLALFLCSDAAQNITGAVLVCDGGLSCGGRRLGKSPV
jgi:NAD(P)-dependent dehydrogenase (short-subunit alcohol dehydrogenase family)